MATPISVRLDQVCAKRGAHDGFISIFPRVLPTLILRCSAKYSPTHLWLNSAYRHNFCLPPCMYPCCQVPKNSPLRSFRHPKCVLVSGSHIYKLPRRLASGVAITVAGRELRVSLLDFGR